jgi:hypothetical protein
VPSLPRRNLVMSRICGELVSERSTARMRSGVSELCRFD